MMIVVDMLVCMTCRELNEFDRCGSYVGQICLEKCRTGEFSSSVVH